MPILSMYILGFLIPTLALVTMRWQLTCGGDVDETKEGKVEQETWVLDRLDELEVGIGVQKNAQWIQMVK